jgi:hypothetical protein
VQEGQGSSNVMRIEHEIVDLLAVIEMLQMAHVLGPSLLNLDANADDIDAKQMKVNRYLEYSRVLGTLDE